jgi:hypothetical protein
MEIVLNKTRVSMPMVNISLEKVTIAMIRGKIINHKKKLIIHYNYLNKELFKVETLNFRTKITIAIFVRNNYLTIRV